MPSSFTISDLAREYDVTPRTLRFWESEGLLTPEREGSHRLYHQRDRTRVKLILRGQRLGFSLAEIREIVNLYDAAEGEAGQLSYLLRRIAERQRELLAKRADIDASLADLAGVAENCERRLAEIRVNPTGTWQGARQA